MEDEVRKNKNDGRRPQKIKWKTNQPTEINLIGCDTIVNSPSFVLIVTKVLINNSPPTHAAENCAKLSVIT